MPQLNVFTEATQQQILSEAKMSNALLEIIASGYKIDSFKAVQKIVQAGGGQKYFPTGTQLVAPHKEYGGGAVLFDVADHDVYKKPDDPTAHSMTLLMHAVIYGRMFDNAEALYAVNASVWPNGLPAGTYNFKLDPAYDAANIGGKTLQFTTAQVVPVGGVLMFTWGTSVDACKISTYATQASTTALQSNLQCTEGSGGTYLGMTDGNSAHVNHGQRVRYGSNHYGESAERQWINSTDAANAWWRPQTEFDRPPSYANVAGFLNGIDPEFLTIVGEVDVVTAYNTVYNTDGSKTGSYTTRDKFFLPSMTELGWGKNNNVDEGAVMDYYVGATNTDRIKYDITNPTTARYWWLRSPHPSDASSVRRVGADGALSISSASSGYGAAAACVIY